MKTIISTALAASFALALATGAHAQSAQIPTPVNPFPINPVATDGTPLPSQASGHDTIYSGRSAAVGGPLGFVGGLADTGLNAAGSIAGAGLGVANNVVGTAGNVVQPAPYGYGYEAGYGAR